MKRFLIFALLILTIHQLKAGEVDCERKQSNGGPSLLCYMNNETTIDSHGFEISSGDEAVEGLVFDNNQKIRFLPEKVAEKFPKLVIYWAQSCSLTEISKIHFENLGSLTQLLLQSNRIEKISSNTFEDLTSLFWLNLRKDIIFHIYCDLSTQTVIVTSSTYTYLTFHNFHLAVTYFSSFVFIFSLICLFLSC